MSRSIALFLTLVLIVGAECQNPCSTNSGPNFEALKWLTNQGVKVNPILNMTNVTQCSGEFTSNGNCCDIQTLSNVIKTFNTNILNKWKKYIGKLATFRSKVLKAAQALSPRLSASLINAKIGVLNNVGAATKLANILPIIPREDTTIADLKAWINGFEDNVKEFKTQSKVCYEMLRSYRSGIFCAMCSGNNGNYASPQLPNRFTYRINQDQCAALINDCYSTWRFNFNVLTLTQFMVILRSRVDGSSSFTSFTPDTPLSSDAIAEIRDVFENCKFNTTTKAMMCGNDSELEKYQNKLCYNGFIGNKVNSYLEGDESALTDVDTFDNLDLVNKEIGANSRRLQSISPIISIELVPSITSSFTIKPSSGLEPTDTIDPSKATDSSYAHLAGTASGLLIISLLALLQI